MGDIDLRELGLLEEDEANPLPRFPFKAEIVGPHEIVATFSLFGASLLLDHHDAVEAMIDEYPKVVDSQSTEINSYLEAATKNKSEKTYTVLFRFTADIVLDGSIIASSTQANNKTLEPIVGPVEQTFNLGGVEYLIPFVHVTFIAAVKGTEKDIEVKPIIEAKPKSMKEKWEEARKSKSRG